MRKRNRCTNTFWEWRNVFNIVFLEKSLLIQIFGLYKYCTRTKSMRRHIKFSIRLNVKSFNQKINFHFWNIIILLQVIQKRRKMKNISFLWSYLVRDWRHINTKYFSLLLFCLNNYSCSINVLMIVYVYAFFVMIYFIFQHLLIKMW